MLKTGCRILAGALLAAVMINILWFQTAWPAVDRSSLLPFGRVADPVLPLAQAPTVEPEVTLHTVGMGDTLAAIASRYGVDAHQLAVENSIGNPNRIYPGQVLQISAPKARFYTIRMGDTLSHIAGLFSVTIQEICRVNSISDPDWIPAGRQIRIPQGAATEVRAYAARASAGHIELAWPIQGQISSTFGWRWGQMHEGLDIAVPYGTNVMAALEGQVSFAGRRGDYGNLIVIDHESGIQTYYGHLSRLVVDAGMEVVAGEVIGRSGTSGKSTGPHLHFEVHLADRPVDPKTLLP